MLEINRQIEVTEEQYKIGKNVFSGLLAHRKDSNGKFFIKPIVFMGHKSEMERVLNL